MKDKAVPGEGGGRTGLHYAARWGNHTIAKLLIEAGADVNARSHESYGTPLALAASKGDKKW